MHSGNRTELRVPSDALSTVSGVLGSGAPAGRGLASIPSLPSFRGRRLSFSATSVRRDSLAVRLSGRGTPEQLREKAERQNAEHPPADGKSRTAEGLEIPNPSRKQFFADLDKVSEGEERG